MSARAEILSRVRQALTDAGPLEDVPRGYRQTAEPPDLIQLFAERVADYRARVIRCAGPDVEGRIADAIDGASVIVPPGLPWEVPGAVVDSGQTSIELDRIDAVVTSATVGIAATGTLVLDHGPGQGRRALTLVADLHVCVVRPDQVVADVPDAVARLDPVRPQTWISGPSATSDIELDRVEGVHGPRSLVVIIAG